MNHIATSTLLLALLSACPIVPPPPDKLQETGLYVELDCHDGLDEDEDGWIDQQDADCWGSIELCLNGLDDDANGLADCFDPACIEFCGEDCGNGLDDDGDGLADCVDPGCAWSCGEQFYAEDCDNGRDDDGDGLMDCEDGACANQAPCIELCDTPEDDDDDGLVGCDDDDCWGNRTCLPASTRITARVTGARGFWVRRGVRSHEGSATTSRAARAVDVSGSLMVGTGTSAVACDWWVAQLDIGLHDHESRYGFGIDPSCPLQSSGFLLPIESARSSTLGMIGTPTYGTDWYVGGLVSSARWWRGQYLGAHYATYQMLDILPSGSAFTWTAGE